MSTRTRIWVFHMKELIYTAVFIVLGVLFLLLFIFIFMPSGETPLAEATLISTQPASIPLP